MRILMVSPDVPRETKQRLFEETILAAGQSMESGDIKSARENIRLLSGLLDASGRPVEADIADHIDNLTEFDRFVAELVTAGVVGRTFRILQNNILRSLDDISSLRGANISEVEKLADAKYLQMGWTKKPLKDGNGVRYFDGKGNSFQLNNGYEGGAEMHGGPYLKQTQGNEKIRIPLEGNPDL